MVPLLMALVWALAFADASCKSSSPTDTSIEVVDDVVDEVVEDSLETLELDELLEAEAEELVPAGSDEEEEETPAPQEASNDPNAKTNKAFETFICESPFVTIPPIFDCLAKLKTSFCWDENEEPPCFDVEQSQGQCVLWIGNYRCYR